MLALPSRASTARGPDEEKTEKKEERCRDAADCDVLVIEDDEDCRDAIFDVLCSEGYRVQTAASGPEALAALATMGKPPRFVLLDVVMPGMSGLDVLRAMRRAPALAMIPVVIHSGLSEQSALGAAVGIVRWLEKPVALDQLLEITRELTT